MENIQNELEKIHNQYGMSEMANYKIQLLFEQYAQEYHKAQPKENVIKPKHLSKLEKGDCVICKLVHQQCKTSLTKGNSYQVIDVKYSSHYNKVLFYILDDKGRKKRYAEDNRQFEAAAS
jgi:hypothetical protein